MRVWKRTMQQSVVDWGGLWHIRSGTFLFFCAIEEELRSYLKVSAVKELSQLV